MNPPSLMLKIIVFVHFTLSMWALQSRIFLPISYLYMNAFILTFGIIAIFCNESSDAVLMFIIGLMISIIQDIIFLGIYEPRGQKAITKRNVDISSEFRFSLGMCITNLLIKPLSIFLLYRILKSRTTDYDNFIPGVPGFAGFGAGNQSGGTYENIDQPSPYRDNPSAPQPTNFQEKSPIP